MPAAVDMRSILLI